MLALHFLTAFEVGNGAGDLEDAAVGTGGELQTLHRHTEHIKRRGIGLGKLMEHTLGHLRVGIDAASPSALPDREGTEALLQR